MSAFKINPEFIIDDVQALRALFPATHTLAALKSQPVLDQHAVFYRSVALPLPGHAGPKRQGRCQSAR